MMLVQDKSPSDSLRHGLRRSYRLPEDHAVAKFLQHINLSSEDRAQIQDRARQLSVDIRKLPVDPLDAFFVNYRLSSQEGIALMCLAEALLRIPDSRTVDNLIRDKLSRSQWHKLMSTVTPWSVRAGQRSLSLAKFMLGDEENSGLGLRSLLRRSSEPVIRQMVTQMMRILCRHFVVGDGIEKAIKRSQTSKFSEYRFSFDMLGEAARTWEEAQAFFASYQHAIDHLGSLSFDSSLMGRPGVSIKLSALHPNFKMFKRIKLQQELSPKVLKLAQASKAHHIGMTIDAEESDTLELMLDQVEVLLKEPSLAGWSGLGVVVQSYQKRALDVIDWLADLSREYERRICVRLVKGAYWDTEIKRAQQAGLDQYPVYTRKVATDVSYIACAQKLIEHSDVIYPQFATHNANSVATILALMGENREFEFQCLFGMGGTLYDVLKKSLSKPIACRYYAPVGPYKELLPYLIRRLLENGANTSFVNQINDPEIPVNTLIHSPLDVIEESDYQPHANIVLPKAIFGDERENAYGPDLTDPLVQQQLSEMAKEALKQRHVVTPLIDGKRYYTEPRPICLPRDHGVVIGEVHAAEVSHISLALQVAQQGVLAWQNFSLEERCACLNRLADLLEHSFGRLLAVLMEEGGKTAPDATSEIREAIDFCRYYAHTAKHELAPRTLNGYTGELNELRYVGRGVVLCISPWNFPLAIFLGQVTAALVAGNSVIAKPAAQTSCIAFMAVELAFAAGIPTSAVQFLPGDGKTIGMGLLQSGALQAVMFTGSTQTGRLINQQLANNPTPIVPFIAETGGINAMIVDSSALYEQVLDDVMMSAFNSAGQRCSALRILYVQEEVLDKYLQGLQGAMATLHVGDPRSLATDVGPVIDKVAQASLLAHIEVMQDQNHMLYQTPLSSDCARGTYVRPTLCLLEHAEQLHDEQFGPVLHVVSYRSNELDKVVAHINQTGYGLTLGIQSRIQSVVERIVKQARVGNCYVNRDMVGAVVGVQPFGGVGYSGTGPKAGGPHYLHRLCEERTFTDNITACGGNASLLTLDDA